ncbi:MAG: tetratricopeptide repeat protein [Gemmatimonadetes bacterium]|nr:tetratricopeptide repeat protein [Gemmatimonadota bacterium]MYD24257.1 tetratricopeptide repeat protein [Gemmatimonadota bacterium]
MTEKKADRNTPAILSTVCKYARPYLFRCLLCLSPLQAAPQDTTVAAVPPQTSSITLEKAVALYESGRHDQAREAFLLMLDDRPEDPVVLYYLGRLDPDREAAEQYFLKVLMHGPEHVLADDALLEVARIQFALERHDDAVNACNRFLSAYPDSELEDEARFLLGQALLAGRRPELSRMVFQQLLASEPDTTLVQSARLAIAESYRAQEDFIEAARQYLRFEIDFQGVEGLEAVLWEAGQCLEAAGRTVEAGFVYQRLIKRYPDSPEANRARVERPLLE